MTNFKSFGTLLFVLEVLESRLSPFLSKQRSSRLSSLEKGLRVQWSGEKLLQKPKKRKRNLMRFKSTSGDGEGAIAEGDYLKLLLVKILK